MYLNFYYSEISQYFIFFGCDVINTESRVFFFDNIQEIIPKYHVLLTTTVAL